MCSAREGEGVVVAYFLQMFGVSLGLTLLLEIGIAFLLGLRRKKEVLLVILVNILTNPPTVLLYWLYRRYCEGASMPVQIVLELVVVIVEAWIYHSFAKEENWRIKRPILLAVVSNVVSWGTGLVVQL